MSPLSGSTRVDSPEGIVAGYFYDPLIGRTACLIVRPVPPMDGAAVVAHAKESFPDATAIIVRLDRLEDSLSGFHDYLYYLSHYGTSEVDGNSGARGLVVRRSNESDRKFIFLRLVEAFDAALTAQQETVVAERLRSQASAVLSAPDAVSYVVESHGEVFGHVTLLEEQYDDYDGTAFVELLDVLVDSGHECRKLGEKQLVRAATEHANHLGRPLVGHIVVEDRGAGYESELLDRLQRTGWAFSHKFVLSVFS